MFGDLVIRVSSLDRQYGGKSPPGIGLSLRHTTKFSGKPSTGMDRKTIKMRHIAAWSRTKQFSPFSGPVFCQKVMTSSWVVSGIHAIHRLRTKERYITKTQRRSPIISASTPSALTTNKARIFVLRFREDILTFQIRQMRSGSPTEDDYSINTKRIIMRI